MRWLAGRFGDLLGRPALHPRGGGADALLNNAARCHRLFGYPTVTLDQMVEWVAGWVSAGARTLGKPTHFQEREGRF